MSLVTEQNVRLGMKVNRIGRVDLGEGIVVQMNIDGKNTYFEGQHCLEDLEDDGSVRVRWARGSVYHYPLKQRVLNIINHDHEWIKVDHPDFPCTMCRTCQEVKEE